MRKIFRGTFVVFVITFCLIIIFSDFYLNNLEKNPLDEEIIIEPTALEAEPEESIVIETTEVVETESEPEEVLKSLGTFKLTAYCPCTKCCGENAKGITSTGTIATEGRTIAVDPRIIPYGTEVIINGYTYIAEDCGGAIKSNRIDIFFENHSEALEFGVQRAEVFIKMKEV